VAAVSSPPGRHLPSRRALLAGAASAAGATALAGCGGKPLREKIRGGARVPHSDVAVLNSLLDVEHYAIAAYAAGIPLLGGTGSEIGKQFLSHELAHAVELAELVKVGGGKAARPQANYNLGDPRTAADGLALLEQAERAQLEAYLRMIPTISGGRVRGAVATIYANEAQHLAVLRGQVGQTPTAAFAVG
jgi:hypothetical protein